jgi:hypothetical protein
MIVWRVEDATGRGPYNSRYFTAAGLDKHQGMEYPTPGEESILYMPGGRCGFVSRAKLAEWFKVDCRRKLHEFGFGISVFEVSEEDVYEGRKQVIFDITQAKLISKHRLYPLERMKREKKNTQADCDGGIHEDPRDDASTQATC